MAEDKIEAEVIQRRAEIDKFFKLAHESPIPHEARETFAGLDYFPYDAAYRVQARLSRHGSQDTISLETSKGQNETFLKYGSLKFEINGQPLVLQAYKSTHQHQEQETLFIPFRDKTSGKESYGAARYLDIPERHDDIYKIDFNVAYNPYCAYSDAYICPFPPRENWLDVDIRAGEKTYKHAS